MTKVPQRHGAQGQTVNGILPPLMRECPNPIWKPGRSVNVRLGPEERRQGLIVPPVINISEEETATVLHSEVDKDYSSEPKMVEVQPVVRRRPKCLIL